MASKSKKRRALMASQRVNLRFEQLEDRHLMSGNPPPLDTNFPPIVYAGSDLSINQVDSASLSGEVLNVPHNLMWSQVSGPGTASFSDPNTIATTATFSLPGVYELQLTAENNWAITSDLVAVTVTAGNVINIDQNWLDTQGAGPYYLTEADTTYVLQTDVSTDGTAFAIVANNVTFDLNGHTVTYDNAQPIPVANGSFEDGTGTNASGWDFSAAPDAERYQGEYITSEVYDGDYSLKFSVPTSGSQHVISDGTVTLEPNTMYSLSGMFSHINGGGGRSNPGVKGYIRLEGLNGEPDREASLDKATGTGNQLVEGRFITGNTSETYRVVVGVENNVNAVNSIFYFDEIRIQRTRVYGVAIGTLANNDKYPGITTAGYADKAIIKNGIITQGADGATSANGLFDRAGGSAEIFNMTVTVHGADSKNISGSSTSDISVHDNTLYNNVKTITSRSTFGGASIEARGEIYNNTIIGGPHVGIYAKNSASQIYNNTIRDRVTYYTNDFAIKLWNDLGSDVHHNFIDNSTGEFSGNGISVEGLNSSGTRVHHNTISVQQIPRNLEYIGSQIHGALGIEMEMLLNVEIYENTVTVVADQTEGYAFKNGHFADTSWDLTADLSHYIHDNHFTALRTNENVDAAAIWLSDHTQETDVRIENNTLVTNHQLISAKRVSNFELRSNTIQAAADTMGFQALEISSGEFTVENLRFIDNIYADALTKQLFEDSLVYHDSVIDPNSWFINSYTTVIEVRDAFGDLVSGADVNIVNNQAALVFSGVSDVNGRVSVVLDQFRTQGSSKTEFNPYVITVSASNEQIVENLIINQALITTINLP